MDKIEFENMYQEVCKRAVFINDTARREGLLAIEGDIDTEKLKKRDIFEYGLVFAVDGTDHEMIKKILSKIIEHEKDADIKTIKTIQMEAVLSIARGDNSRMLRCIMNSFTDFDIYKDNVHGFKEEDWDWSRKKQQHDNIE